MKRVLLAVLSLAFVTGCKREAPKPEADPIADRLEATLRADARVTSVTRVNARTLQVRLDAGMLELELGLDNLRAQCATHPETCDATIARQARGALASLDQPKATAAQVRASVKDRRWLEMIETRLGLDGGADERRLVKRPWIASLSIVYVVDLPDTVRPLTLKAQRELTLDDPATHALAIKNLEAALPAPALTAIGGYEGIYGVYEGDDYCTSQLLFPARFAAIAKQLGGKLIVAAPVRNILIATGRRDAAGLNELRALVKETEAAQPHPLTTELFEWSPEGFKPLAP